MALADKICEAAPLAVWASRKVVLAADYEDDDTLMAHDRRGDGGRACAPRT